jgi:hypothetical protein
MGDIVPEYLGDIVGIRSRSGDAVGVRLSGFGSWRKPALLVHGSVM